MILGKNPQESLAGSRIASVVADLRRQLWALERRLAVAFTDLYDAKESPEESILLQSLLVGISRLDSDRLVFCRRIMDIEQEALTLENDNFSHDFSSLFDGFVELREYTLSLSEEVERRKKLLKQSA